MCSKRFDIIYSSKYAILMRMYHRKINYTSSTVPLFIIIYIFSAFVLMNWRTFLLITRNVSGRIMQRNGIQTQRVWNHAVSNILLWSCVRFTWFFSNTFSIESYNDNIDKKRTTSDNNNYINIFKRPFYKCITLIPIMKLSVDTYVSYSLKKVI